MVDVFQYSENDDNICINITRINGEFTKEELALIRKAKALADLNSPLWNKMRSTSDKNDKGTNLSKENKQENDNGKE